MRKLIVIILLVLFSQSKSYACSILKVDIGSSVDVASQNFDFLDMYSPEVYGKNSSVKYTVSAKDYCEDSQLENADLEVIIYDNKVAGIILTSVDEEFNNEIYEFTKFNIKDPGEDAKGESWKGFKDLSIGNLLVYYTKMELRGEIVEVLKITNVKMLNNTIGEQVIDFIQ